MTTKIRQFFFTIHQAVPAEKAQAVEYCEGLEPCWYMVGLEPYLDKEGSHIHMMFQLKNPRSAQAVKAEVMKLFKRDKTSLYQAKGLGRFKDNQNYLMCETAGEHKDNPKVLDPQPVIWPETYVEDLPKRVNESDSVIEDIRNGATLNQLLNTYPKYVLNNLSKIEKFMKAAKVAGFIRPQFQISRGNVERVPAPWE